MTAWPSLPIFVRLSGRAVVLVGQGEAADAKRRLLERAGATIVGEDRAGDARLAVVADEDDARAEGAAHRLKARGLLVNVVDRAESCDFTLPAIVDRAPVLVAVGTGGVSAGLAAAVRQRLEAILPAGLGQLAMRLGDARTALRARYPETASRRRAIGAALAQGGALDPLDDHGGTDVVARIAAGAPARVAHIRLRSHDPDDMTLREARWLAQADRVTHRMGVPLAVLDRARADAVRAQTDVACVESVDGLTVDVEMA